MPGVGEQRHGIAHQAVNSFDDDEGEIERDPDCEGFAEARRRMGVGMAVTMSVMVVSVAAVVVGHLDRL